MLKSTQPSTSPTFPSELNFSRFVRNVAIVTLLFFVPSVILLVVVTQKNFGAEEAMKMAALHAVLTTMSFVLVVPVDYKFYSLAKSKN